MAELGKRISVAVTFLSKVKTIEVNEHIEPMLNAGKRHVKLLNDNWTVVPLTPFSAEVLITPAPEFALQECQTTGGVWPSIVR